MFFLKENILLYLWNICVFYALCSFKLSESYSFEIESPLDLLRRRCSDPPVEERVKVADIVITGTVKRVLPESTGNVMYNAEVEIVTVMKGKDEIEEMFNGIDPSSEKYKVVVEGFGNPRFCHSKVKVKDTRIFLLNQNSNGALKLNSSIVRITLTNLDRVDFAIKDVPFKPPTQAPRSPCHNVFCPFHATCIPSNDGKPMCHCQSGCELILNPVCGTDKETYSNECELKQTSCIEQRRINKLHDGRCPINPCSEITCPHPSVCKLDKTRQPVCKCEEYCDPDLNLVCGTDRQTYSSPCFLRREACKEGKDIEIAYSGECKEDVNPTPHTSTTDANHQCKTLNCTHGYCIIDRQSIAKCVCKDKCEPWIRPVCSSDGRTHNNECEFHQYACRNNLPNLKISHLGACGKGEPCQQITCNRYQECIVRNGKAKCECPVCPEVFQPVCGSDQVSYTNECHLRQTNCDKDTNIAVAYKGLCEQDGCGNVRECKFYSVCSGSPGNKKCICPEESSCPNSAAKVCGSDDQTYKNECLLRVQACKSQTMIYVASIGDCESCAGKKCVFGAKCENGFCVCPQSCPSSGGKVCASNDQTYANECEMTRAECVNEVNLDVIHFGECEMDTESSGSSGDGSGDEEVEKLIICDESVCPFGGQCKSNRDGTYRCSCDLGCEAIRSPVCGSNGRTYGNLCQMKEEACQRKEHIEEIPMDNCNDIDEEPCDGNPPLVDGKTGQHYDCSTAKGVCPPKSYCHLQYGKCCREESSTNQIRGCWESQYGCCPDGMTSAPAPSFKGCPSDCQCSKYGSFRTTCHPKTGQCDCKSGVGGTKCTFCLTKYWGLALKDYDGCKPCNCNEYGSQRQDCDQNTGQCMCKEGISGLQCDICPDGQIVEFDVCGMEDQYFEYPGTSCDRVACFYGAYCENKDGNARCKCDALPCRREDHQYSVTVCGDDGNTYRSECHLKLTSCKTQRPIQLIYKEPCGDTATRTTSVSMASRSRKTTRHIAAVSEVTRRMTGKSTERPPLQNKFDGKILSICYDDSYCIASNSSCRKGICQCLDGFIPTLDNSHCSEVKAVVPMDTVDNITPCYNSPCRNQGTCEVDEHLGYRCLCPLGKTGAICIQDAVITAPSFSGKSYLELKATSKTNDDVIFEIGMNTINMDGIILFASQNVNGSGDFISLALNKGFLEFRYDLGSGLAIIRSATELKPNINHRILANRFGKRGNLQVDEDPIIHGESPGSLISLDLNGIFYLGNVPEDISEAYDRMDVRFGLSGCINTFQAGATANPHLYNLTYPKSKNSNILRGMDVHECGNNPCRSLPCQNGGSCMMVDMEIFQCLCPPGFSGEQCGIVLDPCLTSNCREGSTCRLNQNGGFECVCPPNMEGEFCEYERLKKIVIPEFQGQSFIKIPMGDIGSNYLAIRIWFMTSQPDGALMYASQYPNGMGDYVSVNIIDRQVEFRYNMGGGTVVIRSIARLELDKWHEVLIQTVDRAGTLILDNDDMKKYTGEAGQGRHTELNLSGKPLVLGGYDNKRRLPVDSGIEKNLTGVIQRIYINGHQYSNLMESAEEEVNIVEYTGPPCNVNPCLNGGICVPRLDEADCQCPTRYVGLQCEKRADSFEKDLPVQFDGSTYLQYPNEITNKQIGQRRNRYRIKFRTNSDGLLLFQNGRSNTLGDYLALAIVNGRVEFSYNLGKQTDKKLHIIRSLKDVSDGQWHNILAYRDGRTGTIQVDDERPILGTSIEGAIELNTNGMLWIGGKSELPLGLPSEYYEGFSGCIEEVYIDYKQLHLFDHRNDQSTSVIKFCSS